jgi:hypothetical protein
MATMRPELQELVDHPNETLGAEYKSWLDLVGDVEARADLARHIAALANYGGGFIVFGFNDGELDYAGPTPHQSVKFDRDLISPIVKKYLEPTFQCDVQIVRSASGGEHPIIIVPAHGVTPICAKAGGPQVSGKVKGISAGVYYTRKAGPESDAIRTAAEWAPIIRRCALHERSSILGAIDSALRGASNQSPSAAGALKTWHDAARALFLKDLENHPDRAAVDAWQGLTKRHRQMSYAVERRDGSKLDSAKLIEGLRQANHEIADISSSASWLFYPYGRRGIEPRFAVDPASGLGDEDFLECNLLRDPERRTSSATFWRVSTDGKATILDQYLEDQVDWCQQLRLQVGSWFSPNLLVRQLAEFVRHARALAERFDDAVDVSFRCEWFGLANRQIFDPYAPWHNREPAREDRRVSAGTWAISALIGDWPTIVSQLAAPVLRAFMTETVVTPDWVKGQAPTWRR